MPGTTGPAKLPPQLAHANQENKLAPCKLASVPAHMLNQTYTDSGIPHRFSQNQKGSSSQVLACCECPANDHFKETVGGALAYDGDKLIHLSDFLSRAFSSFFFRSRCNFSMSFGVES